MTKILEKQVEITHFLSLLDDIAILPLLRSLRDQYQRQECIQRYVILVFDYKRTKKNSLI